jgi:hypothetical protein
VERRNKKREEIEAIKTKIREYGAEGKAANEIRSKLNITPYQYRNYRREIGQERRAGNRPRIIDKEEFLKGKPFWIWDNEHAKILDGRCCFNHIVGLPEKSSRPMPLFDYEKKVLDELVATSNKQKQKHLWIKKATGLGITELFLRYMAWLCYHDDTFEGSQMCIVTGPNINLAKGLIRRMKDICETIGYGMHAKDTAIVLNGCRIEAFPSHHLDAMRSLSSPKFIFLDEADFFPPKEQKNARDIAERYIAKSDPYIVMVSTPNAPRGLYDSIEKEPDAKCIYRRLKLVYTVGLGKIYTEEEIKKAKQSPSFNREYNLKYGYGVGKIFARKLVNKCAADYPLALQPGSTRVLGVDPAFGSSKFAIVGVEKLGSTMYVKEATEFDRPSYMEMLDLICELAKQYPTVLIDAAFPSMGQDLRQREVDVTSVNFRTELPDMTAAMLDAIRGQSLKIHYDFPDLLHQLEDVTLNEHGNPDKRRLSYDLGDALMMTVYHLKSGSELYMAEI